VFWFYRCWHAQQSVPLTERLSTDALVVLRSSEMKLIDGPIRAGLTFFHLISVGSPHGRSTIARSGVQTALTPKGDLFFLHHLDSAGRAVTDSRTPRRARAVRGSALTGIIAASTTSSRSRLAPVTVIYPGPGKSRAGNKVVRQVTAKNRYARALAPEGLEENPC